MTVIGRDRISIGDGTFFHSGAWLSVVEEHDGRRYDPKLTIGERCLFARDVWISCVGEITIGDEVLVGDRVLITDTYHEYEDPDTAIIRQPMAPPRPVRIGDGALLNTGCVITAGVTIGARAFVAANAVVTADVPPNTVVVGNPARAIRTYDRDRRGLGGPLMQPIVRAFVEDVLEVLDLPDPVVEFGSMQVEADQDADLRPLFAGRDFTGHRLAARARRRPRRGPARAHATPTTASGRRSASRRSSTARTR